MLFLSNIKGMHVYMHMYIQYIKSSLRRCVKCRWRMLFSSYCKR